MEQVLRKVGRYELLREIGRGGMAQVWLARQTDLHRLVALKELAAFHATDPAFAERFIRESHVAASLGHPNVVTVHDYCEHDGIPFIAMEYLPRGSLRPYVADLTLTQGYGVLEGLLAGLAHAETRGVVHRDLKPENLLLTDDGRVKIADFGIAKALGRAATMQLLTATGTTVGTPAYMAPEQASGRPVTARTDLYSVGVIAYEMFVGQLPFADSETPVAILMRHVSDPVPPPRALRPELDPELARWIEGLLAKDAGDRPDGAGEAWNALEDIAIRTCGPRWRRNARLVEQAPERPAPRPLTPAPFDARQSGDDGFESFEWGRRSERREPEETRPPDRAPPIRTGPPPDGAGPQRGEGRRAPEVAPGPDGDGAAPLELVPTVPPAPREIPPATPQRHADRPAAAGGRRRVVLAALAGAVVAAGAGAAVGAAGGNAPAPRPVPARNADLALRHPADWRADDRRPSVPGLRPDDPVRLSGPGGVGLVAGRVEADHPSLLPARLRALVEGPRPRAERVSLGPVEALRYRDVRLRGAALPLTVYAVPTTRDVIALACQGAVADGCAGIARTLRLNRARAHAAAPSAALGRRFSAVLADLREARRRGVGRMDAATRSAEQAAAARTIAAAHRAAQRRLRTRRVSPRDVAAVDGLVAALARTERSLSALAEAAERGDEGGFAAVRRRVGDADRRLRAAVRGLARHGYGTEAT